MIHRDSSKIHGVPLLVLSVNSWAQTKNPELTPYKKISSSSCFRWPSWINSPKKRAPKRWLRLLNWTKIEYIIIWFNLVRSGKKISMTTKNTTKKSSPTLPPNRESWVSKRWGETQPANSPDSQAVIWDAESLQQTNAAKVASVYISDSRWRK